MKLEHLRSLLGQTYSFDVLRKILDETARLYREDLENRWFFLLLNRVFVQVLDSPDLIDPDTADPILEVLSAQAINGLEAIARSDQGLLVSSADQLTEAYCGLR
jgi:hypothetical protein